MPQERLVMYTDGGSRGNPGPAAIAVVIEPFGAAQGKEYSEYIGEATNNVAEYRAVIFALKKAKQLMGKEAAKRLAVEVRLDSALIAKQLSGEYKILEKELQPLFLEAWNLMRDFGSVTFTLVPRQENRRADRLVNAELDRQTAKLL